MSPKDEVMNTRKAWAEAIARRIVDELAIEFEAEEADDIEQALFKALAGCPEAINTIIGTKLIEEGYFDEPLD